MFKVPGPFGKAHWSFMRKVVENCGLSNPEQAYGGAGLSMKAPVSTAVVPRRFRVTMDGSAHFRR